MVVARILMVETIIVSALSIRNSIARSCGVAAINFVFIVLIFCGIVVLIPRGILPLGRRKLAIWALRRRAIPFLRVILKRTLYLTIVYIKTKNI